MNEVPFDWNNYLVSLGVIVVHLFVLARPAPCEQLGSHSLDMHACMYMYYLIILLCFVFVYLPLFVHVYVACSVRVSFMGHAPA